MWLHWGPDTFAVAAALSADLGPCSPVGADFGQLAALQALSIDEASLSDLETVPVIDLLVGDDVVDPEWSLVIASRGALLRRADIAQRLEMPCVGLRRYTWASLHECLLAEELLLFACLMFRGNNVRRLNRLSNSRVGS